MQTRVYKVIGADGESRHIECATRAQAIQHVYAPVVSGPLNGGEVAALVREHGADAIERIRVAV